MATKEENGGVLTGGANLAKLKAFKESMGEGRESKIDTSSVGAAVAGFEFPEAVIKEYTGGYKDKKGMETVKKYQQMINAELGKVEKGGEEIDMEQFVVEFFNGMKKKAPKKLVEIFVKNIGKPIVDTAPEPVVEPEQGETNEFEAALRIIKTLQKSKIERIRKRDLTEKELHNPRLLLVGVKNRYLDNDGINANVDWSSITPEEESKIVEAQDAANKEIITAFEEFKKDDKKVKNKSEAKKEHEKIDSVRLEKMLEDIDSQEALINFCEENKKTVFVSGDDTHYYFPSKNRLEEIFSGKADWHEVLLVALRRKIAEIMGAKVEKPVEKPVDKAIGDVAQPFAEKSSAAVKEKLDDKKLTRAEFEQKYNDILGVNFSDEKGENWMYVYNDGYNEKTGQIKIFLQNGSEKGVSKRYSLDRLEEFLGVYTKKRAKGENVVPRKPEKKMTPADSVRRQGTPRQKDLDALDASLKTNGNRRVYNADSTPEDAREAGMRAKNLKKMEGSRERSTESGKEKEINPEVQTFVEASVGEGKKWKEFLESEKGKALFGGDEKVLREKVESFVSGGLKWYADFSEEDKKNAVEETIKKIFS